MVYFGDSKLFVPTVKYKQGYSTIYIWDRELGDIHEFSQLSGGEKLKCFGIEII